jgi:hypothetical protein
MGRGWNQAHLRRKVQTRLQLSAQMYIHIEKLSVSDL